MEILFRSSSHFRSPALVVILTNWNLTGRPRSQFRTGVFGNRYPITRPVTFLRQHFEPKSPILRRECIYAFRKVTPFEAVHGMGKRRMIRRECIYAFRGLLFQNRRVEWENVENTSWEITIQQTTEVIQHFGTDKSVPYAHAGRRPIHLPAKFQFDNKLISMFYFTICRH